MPPRILIGVSVGSGLGAADAAVIRTFGVGLGLTARVDRAVRVLFPPSVLDQLRLRAGTATTQATAEHELTRGVAETAAHAIRSVLLQAGLPARDVFAVGLLDPAHPAPCVVLEWPEVAARVAEQTGATTLHGFRGRDRSAGGTGHPITAATDYLLFRHGHEDRVIAHLGAVTSLFHVPPGAKVSDVRGFEAGPGTQLLDAILYHGSRGRERSDAGGKKAVQGRCLEPLLAHWLVHPYLTRKPPKAVHAEAFGRAFLLAAFDAAREFGAVLPDLLCTATHLVARSVGEAYRNWLPPAMGWRRVLLTGGGVRNGFLWQLLGQQFDGVPIARADEVGVPPLARNAAGAALLAALTCDGVAGNLAPLSGAAGGRLLGSIVPGDARNWARCATWIAEQVGEYPRINRAA